MCNSVTRCLYYKHVECCHVVVVTNTESWSVFVQLTDLHSRSRTYHEIPQRTGGSQRDQERCSTIGLQRPRHRQTLSVMYSICVSALIYVLVTL